MIYFSDVDVVLKLAACGFLPFLPELLGMDAGEIEIQYLVSLRSRLSRSSKKLANLRQEDLEAFCSAHQILGASPNLRREQELLQSGLDPGEALLFAEAEATGGIVVTGDKRALAAYAKVSTSVERAKIKVVCWEQLLLRVHQLHGYESLRNGCCEGIESDKLLSLAFSSGPATQEGHALEALQSYLGAVKAHSADILVQFDP